MAVDFGEKFFGYVINKTVDTLALANAFLFSVEFFLCGI